MRGTSLSVSLSLCLSLSLSLSLCLSLSLSLSRPCQTAHFDITCVAHGKFKVSIATTTADTERLQRYTDSVFKVRARLCVCVCVCVCVLILLVVASSSVLFDWPVLLRLENPHLSLQELVARSRWAVATCSYRAPASASMFLRCASISLCVCGCL
jgi:hypothetical protein